MRSILERKGLLERKLILIFKRLPSSISLKWPKLLILNLKGNNVLTMNRLETKVCVKEIHVFPFQMLHLPLSLLVIAVVAQ